MCGIDEAGRGCVAGSLFISGIMLESRFYKDFENLGVRDSKSLSEKRRNELEIDIQRFLKVHNGDFKTLSFSAKDIDSKGLSSCLREGLEEIYRFAKYMGADEIIFDGNTSFGISGIKTLIKGDSKNAIIAGASILAKCSKDREMLELHERFPQFDFKHNKGYLSKTHRDMIRKYGLCDVHRVSYDLGKYLEGVLWD